MSFELKLCRVCLKPDSSCNFLAVSPESEINALISCLIAARKTSEQKSLICQKCHKRLKDTIKLRNDCIKANKYFQSLQGTFSCDDLGITETIKNKSTRRYQCTTCSKLFSSIHYLKHHEIAAHTHLPPHELFLCDHCEFKSKTKALMRGHQLNNHYNLEEKALAKFQCKFCGKISKSIGALFAHERTHREIAVEDYVKCDFCDKSFKEKRLLKNHIELVHEKSRARQCNQCGFVATCSGSLNKHTKAVHLKLRNHICADCNQGFATNQQLKRHERSHRCEKPFKCSNSSCDKFFADAHGRKRHLKVCLHNNLLK